MGGRTGMGMQHERVGDWAKGWVTCVWGTREPDKAPAGVRTSVAELFYLRHMRSGAASAVGAQRGGGKGPGVIKGGRVAWPGDGEVGITWVVLHALVSKIDILWLTSPGLWLRVGRYVQERNWQVHNSSGRMREQWRVRCR